MVPLSFSEVLFQPRFLLQELIFLSSKMDGGRCGRQSWLREGEWLALRTIARCESPSIRFAAQFGTLAIMPGDDGLQGHEEDVFLDGLPPLSSCTSGIPTIASTPRELAQYGLCWDRIGEADQPGSVMEILCGRFLFLRMLSSEVTWVCTLWVTVREVAFH